MKISRSLSFNDVMLVPKRNTVSSRSEINLCTNVGTLVLGIPIIAANMSSVCGPEMCIAMHNGGALGILHRMCTVDEQMEMMRRIPDGVVNFGISFGVGENWKDRVRLIERFHNTSGIIACLDVAHAHSDIVLDTIERYYKEFPYDLIIGNIATYVAAYDIYSIIPKDRIKSTAFKCGIGGGSLCTTRIKTGCGVPTLQSIMDISKFMSGVSDPVDIIADGGIKNSGDIVKCLAAGASAVMVGRLLAGTNETPGSVIRGSDGSLHKIYRGSASYGDKKLRGEETRNIEGEETLVPYSYDSVKEILNSLEDGCCSGLAYCGSLDIPDLWEHAEFTEITNYGYIESTPHGK